MSVLAGWPGLGRLRSLALSGNDLREDGLRTLLQSPHLGGLKQLAVRDNTLLAESMDVFDEASSGLQLDVLDIGANVLEDAGVADVVRADCLRGLSDLRR